MENSPPPTSEGHPNPLDHWKHRRRIAYTSLFMLIVITAGVFLDAIPATLQPVIETLIWTFGFLVVGYFGNSAFEAFANKRSR